MNNGMKMTVKILLIVKVCESGGGVIIKCYEGFKISKSAI